MIKAIKDIRQSQLLDLCPGQNPVFGHIKHLSLEVSTNTRHSGSIEHICRTIDMQLYTVLNISLIRFSIIINIVMNILSSIWNIHKMA